MSTVYQAIETRVNKTSRGEHAVIVASNGAVSLKYKVASTQSIEDAHRAAMSNLAKQTGNDPALYHAGATDTGLVFVRIDPAE